MTTPTHGKIQQFTRFSTGEYTNQMISDFESSQIINKFNPVWNENLSEQFLFDKELHRCEFLNNENIEKPHELIRDFSIQTDLQTIRVNESKNVDNHVENQNKAWDDIGNESENEEKESDEFEQENIDESVIVSRKPIQNSYGLVVRKLELAKDRSKVSRSKRSRKSSLNDKSEIENGSFYDYDYTKDRKFNVSNAKESGLPKVRGSMPATMIRNQGTPISMNDKKSVFLPKRENRLTSQQIVNQKLNQLNDNKSLYSKNNVKPAPLHKKNEYVKIILESAGAYHGEIENGRLSGFGKLFTVDMNLVYEGEFVDNMFSGFGVMFNSEIENEQPINETENEQLLDRPWIKFEGMFLNNLRNGHGKLYFKDGSTFVGEFCEDNVFGEGLFEYKDNRFLIGYWEEGNLKKIIKKSE